MSIRVHLLISNHQKSYDKRAKILSPPKLKQMSKFTKKKKVYYKQSVLNTENPYIFKKNCLKILSDFVRKHSFLTVGTISLVKSSYLHVRHL